MMFRPRVSPSCCRREEGVEGGSGFVWSGLILTCFLWEERGTSCQQPRGQTARWADIVQKLTHAKCFSFRYYFRQERFIFSSIISILSLKMAVSSVTPLSERLFQLCVASYRRSGSPSGLIKTRVWCRSASPCTPAGSAPLSVSLAASWSCFAMPPSPGCRDGRTASTTPDRGARPCPWTPRPTTLRVPESEDVVLCSSFYRL